MAWRSSSRPRTSQGYRNLITVESIADVVVLVTQSGLKDVNKLLKLDPSNTELVVRKQKMLKDAIELKKRGDDQQNIAGKFTEDRLINGWLYGNMKIQ